MKHTFHHDLDMEVIRQVIDKAWQSYKERFAANAPHMRWIDDRRIAISFTTSKGKQLSAQVELRPGAIDLDMEVPFMFRLFKNTAISVVDSELKKWISEAKKSSAG